MGHFKMFQGRRDISITWEMGHFMLWEKRHFILWETGNSILWEHFFPLGIGPIIPWESSHYPLGIGPLILLVQKALYLYLYLLMI